MSKNSPLYISLFIVIILAITGGMLALVNSVSKQKLIDNQKKIFDKILYDAFDANKNSGDVITFDSLRGEFFNVDKSKIGIPFVTNGFWDKINGIIVVDSTITILTNIRFFEQHETPGLGARIEESSFTNQFRGLKIDWNKTNGAYLVFDGITGASQTSMALRVGLNAVMEKIKIEKGK